jgi:quinolinate synthase
VEERTSATAAGAAVAEELAEDIRELARERGAVILAHNYQIPDVQDVADFTGDSLGLAREAARVDADVIVFAGVHFMAETAKILSPAKTVLLPEIEAGCPMADMITRDALVAWKEENPGVPVVTYVNSSAEVKAVSDVCCTSANAIEVVRGLDADRILFTPDRNLAHWVSRSLPDVEVEAWDGMCIVHDRVTSEMAEAAIAAHPGAEVLAHPECRPDVVDLADHVLSTSQMLARAAESDAQEFVILTEGGLLHALEKAAPGKVFHEPHPRMVCRNMKKTDLGSVRSSLAGMRYEIDVPEDVRVAALTAVERMVAVG